MEIEKMWKAKISQQDKIQIFVGFAYWYQAVEKDQGRPLPNSGSKMAYGL